MTNSMRIKPSPPNAFGGEGWVRGAFCEEPSLVLQPARPSLAGRSASRAMRVNASRKRSASPLTPTLSPNDRAIGGEGGKAP